MQSENNNGSHKGCIIRGRIVGFGQPAEIFCAERDAWGRLPCHRQVLLARDEGQDDEQLVLTVLGNVARFFPFQPGDQVHARLRFDVVERQQQFINIIYADLTV